jgi:hypothetical protein
MRSDRAGVDCSEFRIPRFAIQARAFCSVVVSAGKAIYRKLCWPGTYGRKNHSTDLGNLIRVAFRDVLPDEPIFLGNS